MQLPISLQKIRLPRWMLIAGVISGLVGYCIMLGVLAGKGKTTYLLALVALPAAGLAVTLLSRYFQSFVLLLPITALTLPRIELPTGTESKLPISMLLTLGLTALWFAAMFWRGWRLVPSPLNRPILALGAVFIISLIWGILWRDPILIDAPKFIVTQLGALLTLLLSLAATILVGNFFTTEGQLKYLVWAFIGIGFLMTLSQLARLNQPLLNDRGLWGTWVIAPAYGMLIAQPKLGWRWRAALLVVIGLTFYQTMIVNSFWISGWIPSVLAVVAITFLRSWKAFLGLIVLGVVAVILSWGFFADVAQDNIDDGSLERLEIWSQNWSVVREHWLLGTGPAGYAIYYMSYFPENARSTHNNYLDILAQFGFIGMGIWAWLMVTSLWEGWTLVRRFPPGFKRTLAIIATGGWAAALGSMLFGDWVLPFAYNQGIAGFKYTVYSWLFLGTLIRLRQMLPQTHNEYTLPVIDRAA
jgi:hypothetical protein